MTKEPISDPKRKWWILAAMTTAASMIFIDVTILPVALPSISHELGVSSLALQWILNAYTLALTVLVLAGGRLSDMWGMRTGFCIGLGLFATASALCGISNSADWLIFNRALQGAGGALMIPAAQGIILHSFSTHERGKAFGLYVSFGAIFLAIGPMIGGLLTQYLTWRYTFWINLPIAAMGLILTLWVVPSFPKRRESFDMLGFLTLGIGASSIITGVMNAQTWGWDSPFTLFLIAFGIFLITVLIRSERKIHHPLIDLSLINTRKFLAPTGAICCVQFIGMVTIFWALYFQDILLYSPSHAGFIVFLANAPILISAPLAGFLVDRYGPRLPVILGFCLTAFSLIWFVIFHQPTHVALLLPALIPFGLGIPLISTPCFVSIMNEIPAEKRGSISGISLSVRQFASTLGLACFGSLFHFLYSKILAGRVEANPQTAGIDVIPFNGVLTQPPEALQILKQMPTAMSLALTQNIRQASIDAFNLINLMGVLIALGGIWIALKWLKAKAHEE